MIKLVKKWDIIIIISLFICSFLPYCMLKDLGGTSYKMAYITVDGKPYKEILLTGQIKRKEYVIKSKYGVNKCRVENEGIQMVDATCKDHICEEFGMIKNVGEVIVCLPNRVYIEIKGNDTENKEDVRTY